MAVGIIKVRRRLSKASYDATLGAVDVSTPLADAEM